MKRFAFLATVVTTVLVLVLPFMGGGGPGLIVRAVADSGLATPSSSPITSPQTSQVVDRTLSVTVTPAPAGSAVTASESAATDAAASAPAGYDPSGLDGAVAAIGGDPWDQVAHVSAPGFLNQVTAGSGCPTLGSVNVGTAPSARSGLGVPGTTSDDVQTFAAQYNAIRIANCLPPVTRFVYDSCMEARLFWMAESPSPDPLDAWGHIGTVRIDGVPSVGCDGNLAGGSGNTGATVAQKWWDSTAHRASLYRPGTSVAGVCIALAMTHGGIDEPYSFTRAAARWVTC